MEYRSTVNFGKLMDSVQPAFVQPAPERFNAADLGRLAHYLIFLSFHMATTLYFHTIVDYKLCDYSLTETDNFIVQVK